MIAAKTSRAAAHRPADAHQENARQHDLATSRLSGGEGHRKHCDYPSRRPEPIIDRRRRARAPELPGGPLVQRAERRVELGVPPPRALAPGDATYRASVQLLRRAARRRAARGERGGAAAVERQAADPAFKLRVERRARQEHSRFEIVEPPVQQSTFAVRSLRPPPAGAAKPPDAGSSVRLRPLFQNPPTLRGYFSARSTAPARNTQQRRHRLASAARSVRKRTRPAAPRRLSGAAFVSESQRTFAVWSNARHTRSYPRILLRVLVALRAPCYDPLTKRKAPKADLETSAANERPQRAGWSTPAHGYQPTEDAGGGRLSTTLLRQSTPA